MKNLFFIIYFIVLFDIFSVSNQQSNKIICYYTNWAQYRPGNGKYLPENVDPFLCTHIIYSFAKLTGDQIEPYEWNDLSTPWSKGMFERTMALKNQNPKLKILIAIGGWNHGSGSFSTMVHNQNMRQNFVSSVVNFLKTNGFDGLDMDWEYPGSREGSQKSDKQLFTTLLMELKSAFEPYEFLLTAAVGAGFETIVSGYEISKITQYLDYINLMSYDLHGSWENFLGLNAPLYARRDEKNDEKQVKLNVDWAVQFWLSQGANRDKLLLGMGTYGRSFTLQNPSKTTLGSTAIGAGSAGKYTRAPGFLSYYEICENLNQGWTKEYNEEQKAPYAYFGTDWVGYDDIKSLTEKAEYIKANNLGGAMFWALDLDDFDGSFCNMGKYPLINSVKALLNDGIPPVTPVMVKTSSKSTSPNYPLTNNPINNKCPNGDGYYADISSNCEKYYLCIFTGTSNQIIQTYTCSKGLVFDINIKSCNYESSVRCINTDNEISTMYSTLSSSSSTFSTLSSSTIESKTEIDQTTSNMPTILITTSSLQFTELCKNGNGYYVDFQSDCEKYYFCAFAKTKFERVYNYTCTKGLKFNLDSRKCETSIECQIERGKTRKNTV